MVDFSLEEMQARAEDAVRLAKSAGAQAVWAATGTGRSVEFRYRDGTLEQAKEATSQSLHLRLFVEGRYSVHSSTDLRPDSLTQFVAQAVALTRALEIDPLRELPDPKLYARTPLPDLDLFDPAVLQLDKAYHLARCQELHAGLADTKNLISSTAYSGMAHGAYAAASSNGFGAGYKTSSVSIFGDLTVQDGEKRPSEWAGAGSRHLEDLPGGQTIIEEAKLRIGERLGAVPGPTKESVMVVDNRSAGQLVGRLLGPASGHALFEDQSF